jgi:hypothetical protein
VDSSAETDCSAVAFITKSNAPDLERCELLCSSLELLAPGVSHWIIVDRWDRSALQLENAGTRLVMTEELLPRRLRRQTFPGTDKNVWLAAGMRQRAAGLGGSWAKFAMASVVEEDILIHADSDVVLITRFREKSLTDTSGSPRWAILR